MLPTTGRLNKFDGGKRTCPLCDSVCEDRDHIMRCPHTSRAAWRRECLRQVSDYCHGTRTYPHLTRLLVQGLASQPRPLSIRLAQCHSPPKQSWLEASSSRSLRERLATRSRQTLKSNGDSEFRPVSVSDAFSGTMVGRAYRDYMGAMVPSLGGTKSGPTWLGCTAAALASTTGSHASVAQNLRTETVHGSKR
jgi:hypothetical protein